MEFFWVGNRLRCRPSADYWLQTVAEIWQVTDGWRVLWYDNKPYSINWGSSKNQTFPTLAEARTWTEVVAKLEAS